MERAFVGILAVVPLAACAGAPGLAPADYAEIVAFQDGLRRAQARPVDELFVEADLATLPEGGELFGLDVHGYAGNGSDQSADGLGSSILCIDPDPAAMPRLRWVPWERSIELPQSDDPEFSRYYGENDDGEFFAAAGRVVTGFDVIHRIAFRPDVGSVLVAEKGGRQVLAVGDDVREGDFFDPEFTPVLSPDGRFIAYAAPGLFRSTAVVAPTTAPTESRLLEHPGVLEWPVHIANDGRRFAAAFAEGGRMWALDDGVRFGPFDKVRGPFRYDPGQHYVFVANVGGQEHYIVDGRELPAFDSIWGIVVEVDGSTTFVGNDTAGSHVVRDGVDVFTHPSIKRFVAHGASFAVVTHADDGDRIVHGAHVTGPFGAVEQLGMSNDGATVAFAVSRDDGLQWHVAGVPVGEGFRPIDDVQLADGGGYAFERVTEDGVWLVTGAARSGPWDWIGTRRIAADGSRIAFAAGRGPQVVRRVLPLH